MVRSTPPHRAAPDSLGSAVPPLSPLCATGPHQPSQPRSTPVMPCAPPSRHDARNPSPIQIDTFRQLHPPVRELLASYLQLAVLGDRTELPRGPADNGCLFSVVYGTMTALLGDPADPALATIKAFAGGAGRREEGAGDGCPRGTGQWGQAGNGHLTVGAEDEGP